MYENEYLSVRIKYLLKKIEIWLIKVEFPSGEINIGKTFLNKWIYIKKIKIKFLLTRNEIIIRIFGISGPKKLNVL